MNLTPELLAALRQATVHGHELVRPPGKAWWRCARCGFTMQDATPPAIMVYCTAPVAKEARRDRQQ